VIAELALAATLAGPAFGAVELVPLTAPPVEGRETVLTLRDGGAPAAGVAVTAIYRENGYRTLRHEQEIGTTGSDGSLVWRPQRPGVVVLTWEGGSANVSVRFDGIPVSGVVVALVAGILLLGGSTYFFRAMLLEGGELPPETRRVDT